MGLAAVVHYLTLVIDYILYGKSRRNHLAARAVVVKLASRQGQNGHAQRAQLVVDDLRIGAERTPEIGIQVVFGDILTTAGALHEQADGTVAEHPHAYVGKVKTCLQKVVKFGYARFLEHSLQHRGRLAVADEHTVVGGDGRIEPQAVAHHVGIGHGRQLLGSAYIYVAAYNHRMDIVGREAHQTLIQRKLQVEQRLRKALSALPSEHGNGCKYLTRRSIRRQPAALASGMEQYAASGGKPVGEITTLTLCLMTLFEQPRGTAATAEFVSHRVICTKIFIAGQPRYVMKTAHKVGRK